MSHEPECEQLSARLRYEVTPCICVDVRAAYQRGVDDTTAYAKQEYKQGLADGYRDGEKEGYLNGYNDHARSRQQAEAIYGPYNAVPRLITKRMKAESYMPVDEEAQRQIAENMGRYMDEQFNQHGKGENP